MDEEIPIIPSPSPDLPQPSPDLPPSTDPIHHSDIAPLVLVIMSLFAIVLFLVSRFGNIKFQAWYVTVVCTIGWFFPFWIIFLLPLDLASTVHDDKKGRVPFAYVSQSFLFVAWRVIYWTSFCLTWMMIPMMQAYVNTGDFTVIKRLKSAVNVNLKFYSIYVVVGTIGLIYLVFGSGLTTREGIQSYVMAAANSWGLFLVIVFMGYGLVSVPRNLWCSGNYDRHLHQHYANAAKLKEECMDSEIECNELAKTMNAISKRTMMEQNGIRYCINTMVRRFPFVLHEAYSDTRNTSIVIPRDLTEEYLVKITRRMVLAIRIRDRKNALWKNLLNEAFYLQDIIANKDKSSRKFTSTLRPKRAETKWSSLLSQAEWWWTLRISPNLYKMLAIVFSVVSVCIIWSELTFNVRKPAIISIVYYALNACGMNYAALEIMAFLTLLYMCICVYHSLFKIRFFNLYLLIPNHHTDENSLLWFTGYMCKMMAPLCYNYINLAVDAPGVSKAVFTTFMGKADLIKFLGAFADWFPIIILIPSLSLLFNVQGRCLGLCGIKSPYQAGDDDEQDEERANNPRLLNADYEEGYTLVQEERRIRERELNPHTAGPRVITNNARNREYTTKKYGRASPPDTLRNERDRRVDEILSGRSTSSQPQERYHDRCPSSSSSSVNNEHIDAMKLKKTNLISFGDTVKHKLGGLFSKNSSHSDETAPSSTTTLPENNTSRSNNYHVASSEVASAGNNENHFPSSSTTTPSGGGRVFGRASNPTSRSTSPTPFTTTRFQNSNASPFARFNTSGSSPPPPPSNNIFDDI